MSRAGLRSVFGVLEFGPISVQGFSDLSSVLSFFDSAYTVHFALYVPAAVFVLLPPPSLPSANLSVSRRVCVMGLHSVVRALKTASEVFLTHGFSFLFASGRCGHGSSRERRRPRCVGSSARRGFGFFCGLGVGSLGASFLVGPHRECVVVNLGLVSASFFCKGLHSVVGALDLGAPALSVRLARRA